jgi:PAS domain S-box-containing protein
MTNRPSESPQELRRRAEEKFSANEASTPEALSSEETARLLHDLHVHQIELEMQNTELRRMQQYLETTKASYVYLYELAPMGYLTVNERGVIQKANLAAALIFDMAREDLLNKPITKLIFREDQTVFYLQRNKISDENEAQAWDMRLVRVDGSSFWAHLQATPVHNGEYLVTFSDITERKRADEALKESEERNMAILMTALDGFCLVDASTGNLIKVNDASASMLGYTREELLARGLKDIDLQWSPEEIYREMQKIKTTGKAFFETQHRTKSGQIIDVEISANYLPRTDQLFSFIRNITERKLFEESLHESEAHYRSLFDNSLIGVTAVNCDSIIIEANDAFCKMLEYEKEEVVGKMSFADITHPDDTKISIDYISEIITKEIDNYSLEKRYISKTGKTVTAMIYVRGLYNLDGKYKGSTASILDISEIKQAGQDKLLLEQQFQQAQKMESLGILAGGIAHDFNNILTVIICNCSLLQRQPAMVAELVSEIDTAAQRAADLCRQMLIYAGKGQPIPTKFNVKTLVKEMVKMLKATINKNVTITLDLSTDIPSIKADASQIRQVVMNLIINASEAIGTEQGNITVSLGITEIEAGQSERDYLGKVITPGSYNCLNVTDNGCGMDEGTKQRIFEPFYTTKFTGRGLGMSAVLGIIKAHNGALQLTSQQGFGTTFKVYLPVQSSEPVGDLLPHVSLLPWQGSGTVLLVEDEPQLIKVAKRLIQALGFSVIEATNGQVALEMYQKNAEYITLVFTDIGMPVMDGYELIRELKLLDPDLPIIVSSGFGDAEATSRISENIAGLISKPYSFDQLRKVLKGVVEGVQKQA